MKEKKSKKINFNIIIIALILIGIVSVSIIFVVNNMNENKAPNHNGEIIQKNISDTLDIKSYKNKDYYIIKGEYSGEYDLQFISLSQYFGSQSSKAETFEKKEVMDYSTYKSYCDEWGLKQTYLDTSKQYIVFSYMAYGSPNLEARIAEVEYNENNVDLYIWDDARGVTGDISAYCMVIPTEKEINNINVIGVYTNTEFNNIQKYDTPFNPKEMTDDKPVIYLYPTEETEISVNLINDDMITCSYPKYSNGWKVLAKPNGDLKDLTTGRGLYSLYYESKNVVDFQVTKEGFVVRGEDSATFLEEKLAVLGLTEREAEEFIIYWLPKLESNKYNYIRFATEEEINNNMPLEINPNPDTIIRVLMSFKGLEESIEVEEQKLNTPERNGFTVVEWGGTEIK